ncbi:hypothetical protein RFI_00082 [Reticulomyxa filosa]|uniref:PH domain-containing protein n=1 Tax=Reticulomyxa filosa TaxID=46433 RepID=X6PER7_RETFI|nr:hypothetical protein RFI_00082 [Reticulomyxa filosa]|eukprot:ETO36980.1 hypothetical protein RFI_00082 [Reticulomyxa filosa]
MLPGLKGGIQMHFAQKYASALETDKDKEEKTSQRMTSLHPYPLVGPIPKNPMPWCCQNPKCQSTMYGVLYTYDCPCWISQQFFGNWCLCDTCCQQYTISISEVAKRKKVKEDENDAGNDSESVKSPTASASPKFTEEQTEEDKAQGVIRKGWMTKQGGSIKTWKKRFCVLRKDKTLTYYDSEKMKEKSMKGIADFMWAFMIKRVGDNEFRVSTSERIWAFKCKNQEDRDAWINAFQHCINRADLVVIDDISEKKSRKQSKADKKLMQEQEKLEKQQKQNAKNQPQKTE